MTFIQKVEKSKKLIKKYLKKYPDKCVVACSFGKDSMVLYHLAKAVKRDIPVFSIMTPYKPKQTLAYKDKMTKKYKMNIFTGLREERLDQPEWHKTDPDACCMYYKVEPTGEALQNYDCWFAGLRKSESKGRAKLKYIVNPDRFGKIKINPILHFNELDIWRYLAINKIPVNPLYKKGYRSLGCAPCMREEIKGNETERAGRWVGTSKCGGEGGIHSIPQVIEPIAAEDIQNETP